VADTGLRSVERRIEGERLHPRSNRQSVGARARAVAALLLILVGSPMAAVAAEPFAAYEGWRPVAGDTHRHAGTAYSVLAYARNLAGQGSCPHEWGDPTAILMRAKKDGYDWLNLSFHVGVSGIVKPDKTPHRLVGSARDPAYLFWSDPVRRPILDTEGNFRIDPSPLGFPDFERGGAVDPPYNEALSLASAANNMTANGVFVAFAGREFTTVAFTPQGGKAGQGGHKSALFPGDLDTSCGITDDPKNGRECESESELYRWAAREDGVLIVNHPG